MYSFIMVRSRPTTRVPITQGEGLKNKGARAHRIKGRKNTRGRGNLFSGLKFATTWAYF